ncbi:ABC transporter ATP-binding protein [Nisaea sediminum]|uniref:ABC transporter ATP-binding protein n=1 Tax=Nisaea sediminum TaxID=2775867 RepID=UPI001867D80B|nr:ABC transporter ATP-binding protein [Nisaea sediminum]
MIDQLTPLLRVRDLQVAFDLPGGELLAVNKVSFQVRAGSTVALVGESGSGKSVVSQAIMGLLPSIAQIRGGSILFADDRAKGTITDIARLKRNSREMRQIRGGRISLIFQEPMTSLSPLHTVGNQIREALELHRSVSGREANELTEEMLRMVGFPDPVRAMRTYPFELSGGLRQRAMISMALICRPSLLIADEPTTALDVTIQAQILKLMKDLQAELGMAVLMITHDLGVVANMADDVVVMYRGRIMESGTRDELYRNPQHPYLKALMAAVPRFNMEPGERLVPIREIKSETGHLLAPTGEEKKAPQHKPILKVDNLSKCFTIRKGAWLSSEESKVYALDDVSFEVKPGECLGLVGESGCGKTTLSKTIMRALSPDQGSVTYCDQDGEIDVLGLSGDALTGFRQKLQFVFQDPFSSLNPRMTVFDIVSEPLVIHGIGDDAYRREMVSELMKLVGLDARHLNRYPHSFSGGQRQRIGIARALALKPRMLICDEPVSALDVSIQAQVLNLLKDLQEQLNLTYLFISHNLAVVDYIADRIAVMCAGRLVELAPREELFRNPVHPYTKALLRAVPDPSLDNPLDFESVMDQRCSVPSEWPAPFTVSEQTHPRLIDLGGGHFVRADESALTLRLAS